MMVITIMSKTRFSRILTRTPIYVRILKKAWRSISGKIFSITKSLQRCYSRHVLPIVEDDSLQHWALHGLCWSVVDGGAPVDRGNWRMHILTWPQRRRQMAPSRRCGRSGWLRQLISVEHDDARGPRRSCRSTSDNALFRGIRDESRPGMRLHDRTHTINYFSYQPIRRQDW